MTCLECNKEFETTTQKVIYAGKVIAGVLMAGYKARNTWKDPNKSFWDAPTNRELMQQNQARIKRNMNKKRGVCNSCGRFKGFGL